jgi:predicted transposase YdaD
MQPDPELYYRILNELTTYLRQYQPPNPWRVMVLYPKRSTERVVPQMEKLLAFCNLYRFYLNELRTGVSLGQDILRLMVSSQTEVQARARELLERAQQQLSEPREQNNFIELLIETVTRIFPEQSKEEIRKMLELVPVTQTRFYREVKQEGHDEGYDEGYDEGHDEGYEEGHDEGREQEARSLILRLLSRRFGEIPPQAQTQIEQLNLEQMESLAEALLDFSAIADLLSWLKQQQAG